MAQADTVSPLPITAMMTCERLDELNRQYAPFRIYRGLKSPPTRKIGWCLGCDDPELARARGGCITILSNMCTGGAVISSWRTLSATPTAFT